MRRNILLITTAFIFLFHSGFAHAATDVSGILSSDTTWMKSESPYVVSSDLTIPVGVTLSVEPGVIIKFANSYVTFFIDGTLSAQGTVNEPIIFTSYKDDTAGGDTNGDGTASFPDEFTFPPSGDWRGIHISSGAIAQFDHSSIRYGGQVAFTEGLFERYPMVSNRGGTLTLRHSDLHPGLWASDALNQSDGDTTVIDSLFTLAPTAIDITGGTLSIHGSTFSPTSNAMTNESTNVVDATNNWWGDASGPTSPENPFAGGARVTGLVQFDPFLSYDPNLPPPPTITLESSQEGGFGGDPTSPGVDPNEGGPTTEFTFKALYINSDNHSNPVRLVVAGDNVDTPCHAVFTPPGIFSQLFVRTAYAATQLDGQDPCLLTQDFSGENTLHDGNYINAEQLVTKVQFPLGTYFYHFETDGARYPVIGEFSFTVTNDPIGVCIDATLCNSNILFLPGIESSRLYRPDYKGGTDQLWEPNTESDVTDLFLDDNGNSVRDDIYTKDVIDEANVLPLPQPNIYKSFLSDLKKWRDDEGIIADYAVAPYDWRLSMDDVLNSGNQFPDGRIYYGGSLAGTTSPFIIDTLRRLARSSRTGKVTIMAHSNGGLVAKALARKLGNEAGDVIDKIILIAVPQVGTPQAMGALLHGYDQGLPKDWLPAFLDPPTARAFASTSPMAYQLLPSNAYFGGDGLQTITPIATFGDGTMTQPFISSYGHAIGNFTEYQNFLLGNEGRAQSDFLDTVTPSRLRQKFLSYSNDLHDILDNWVPPPQIKVDEIAGVGNNTVAGIYYWTGRHCVMANGGSSCRAYTPTLEYTPNLVVDGDGTVVTASALAMSTSSANVSRWWVDLYGYNGLFTIQRKHADILEVPELRQFLKQKILSSDVTLPPQYISSTQPPESQTRRLSFFLHSPLTLSVLDSAGHITNESTSTIPGGVAGSFGEVSYISVPANSSPTLHLDGVMQGSFSLDIRETEGNNVIASTTFTGIPCVTKTKGTMGFPDNTLAHAGSLQIDIDSDGTTDLKLTPKIGDIVVPPIDTTPPEAVILFSTSTHAVVVRGIDEGGAVTVSSTTTFSSQSKHNGDDRLRRNDGRDDRHALPTTVVTIIDRAQNATTLTYVKNYPEKEKETSVTILSLSYNGHIVPVERGILEYNWETNKMQSFTAFDARLKTFATTTESHYIQKKNKTTIVTKQNRRETSNDKEDDNNEAQQYKTTVPGFFIPGFKTKNGDLEVIY